MNRPNERMTVTKLGTLMEALQKDVSSVAEAVSGLASKTTSVDGRLGRLEEDMAVVKPAVSGLLIHVDSIDQRLGRVEKDIAVIKPLAQATARDLAELKTDVKDHLARVDERLSALETKPSG